jgi:hypothetical protein
VDWLSKHNVLIDCTKKSIKLTTPDGKELEFVTEPVVTAKGVDNHAKVNQLDASQGSEVPVGNEFPNVFPEELLGIGAFSLNTVKWWMKGGEIKIKFAVVEEGQKIECEITTGLFSW